MRVQSYIIAVIVSLSLWAATIHYVFGDGMATCQTGHSYATCVVEIR